SCVEASGCLHDNQCQQFCSSGTITIADGATIPTPSAPSPSTTTFAGFATSATLDRVDVTITHTFPDDIDMLLVGPGGQNAIIMADAGGSADVTNLQLKLSDAAASALSDAGPLVAGTYRPSNYVPADAWPAPAPAPAGGSALSV